MKNKRAKIVFAAIGTILFTLTACSFTEKNHGLSAKNPQEIVVWNYYNGTQEVAFENMVNEFNSTVGMEKGIIVNTRSKSSINELADALMASVNEEVGADDLPDIVQGYKDTIIELENRDLLVNLDDYISKEYKESFVSEYIEDANLGKDKEWKLFPIAKSTEVITLNKQKWDAFSKDTGAALSDLSTWEGLAETAGKYYEWSGEKAFFGRDAFSNYMKIGSDQLGHPICALQEDGTVKIQTDEETLRKLWNNYYVPYIKGYYSHIGKYRTDDIKLGKIIAGINSTTGCAYFPDEVSYEDEEPYAIDCIVLPVPNFTGTQPEVVQQGADMAVVKGTEKEEYASVVFLEWFTEADRNIEFAIQTGYLPVKSEKNTERSIEEQLDETQTDLGKIDRAVLTTAVKELTTYKMYLTPEFNGSYNIRNVLETSMIDRAKEDYEAIQTKIREGNKRDEVLADYLSDESFKSWFHEFKDQLAEAMK